VKRLVINADDFGMAEGVSSGIVQSILQGVVCSTTAMMCREGSMNFIRRWGEPIKGRIGIHLQLTDGTPCQPPDLIPSLVTEDGIFPRSWRNIGKLNLDEVRIEWKAQVEKFLSLGLNPSNIDSHHHVHRFPEALKIFSEIAVEYSIPARAISLEMAEKLRTFGVRCADFCEIGWNDLTSSGLVACLENTFKRLPEVRTIELMCHPGLIDENLQNSSTYVSEREKELATLCDETLLEKLDKKGIEIIAMSDI
jgi:predicted glycoside hydrolase/deacetylase ChbG (UPF0249 family)